MSRPRHQIAVAAVILVLVYVTFPRQGNEETPITFQTQTLWETKDSNLVTPPTQGLDPTSSSSSQSPPAASTETPPVNLTELDRSAIFAERTSQAYYEKMLSVCGPLCDDVASPPKGDRGPLGFQHRQVPVSSQQCRVYFSDEMLLPRDGHMQMKPPPKIPPALRDGYTLRGNISITPGYYNNIYHGKTASQSVWTQSGIEDMRRLLPRGLRGNYGAGDSLQLFLTLNRTQQVKGGRVLVIGSENPWVEAIVLEAGANEILTLEYGTIISEHPQISTCTPAEFKHRFLSGTLGTFDAIVSYSSLEHSGLGRYGDALNPWQDVLEIARAHCVTRAGGALVLGLMGGGDAVVWNAHRRYGPVRWSFISTNWNQVGGVHKVGVHALYAFEKSST